MYALLQEDGFKLLQEDGFSLLLENPQVALQLIDASGLVLGLRQLRAVLQLLQITDRSAPALRVTAYAISPQPRTAPGTP